MRGVSNPFLALPTNRAAKPGVHRSGNGSPRPETHSVTGTCQQDGPQSSLLSGRRRVVGRDVPPLPGPWLLRGWQSGRNRVTLSLLLGLGGGANDVRVGR